MVSNFSMKNSLKIDDKAVKSVVDAREEFVTREFTVPVPDEDILRAVVMRNGYSR